jgi:hypothetical protein
VKTPPTEVTEPLVQLLQYLLWFAFAIFTIRLIWAAGRLAYARNQSPHETDAGQSIVVTLISAVFASAATGIAAALLTF